MIRNILLKIAFDGTDFGGFQVQKNAPSIQKTVQQAVEAVTGEQVNLTGCSRTDSGVHAREYFCLTKFTCGIPIDRLSEALSAKLPDSIAVTAAYEVPEGFHPRYSAKSKTYRYTIRNTRIADPFSHRFEALLSMRLDEKEMNKAAQNFVGTHDFKGFMASGSSVLDTVRTIFACEVKREGDVVTMEITGDGFLYNMVRIIAGTLVEVGSGKRKEAELTALIASGRRENAGKTMPAKGLMLVSVHYGEGYCFD
jgi:tRNA pseudouridine38-40 synthase